MKIIVPAGATIRAADIDFSDLTTTSGARPDPAQSPSWSPDGTVLEIPFDPEPTLAEQVLIRRRLMTTDPAQEAWVTALASARASEDTVAIALLLADRALMGIDSPQEA